MSQGSRSQSDRGFEQKGMKKISQFITKFYSMLLPRTNSQCIRDRIQDEHYLLSHLDSDSLTHSILAGCLAIDQSLINIFEAEKTLTLSLLQDMNSLLNYLHLLSNSLNDLFKGEGNEQKQGNYAPSVIFKKMEEGLAVLTHHLHQLPSAQHNEQLHQQDSIIELTHSLTAHKAQGESLDSVQNSELEKQLTAASNKIALLQSQLEKATQHTIVQDLRQKHAREKQHLNREILELQDELQAIYKYKNMNLIGLLQELEEENYQLREEKKHNQQIILSIQEKLEYLTFTHNHESTLRSGSRLQVSRRYPRHSELDRPHYNEGVYAMNGRSHYSRKYGLNNENSQMRKSATYSPRKMEALGNQFSNRWKRQPGQYTKRHNIAYKPRERVPRNYRHEYLQLESQVEPNFYQLQRYRSGNLEELAMSGSFGKIDIPRNPPNQNNHYDPLDQQTGYHTENNTVRRSSAHSQQ